MGSRPPIIQSLMQLRKRRADEEPENVIKTRRIEVNTNLDDGSTKSPSTNQISDESEEEIQPTIFDTLNQDCSHELLDWLDTDSLCRFSQTCKSSQQMAKNYFNKKYPSLAIDVGDEEESKPRHLECFGDVVQHLQLSGAAIEDFQFAVSKVNKNLREISFNRTTADKKEDHLTKEHVDSIQEILQNVKTVCAAGCIFKKGGAEHLLAKCERIEDFGFAVLKDSKHNFQFQKMLTLKNLEISFDSRVNAFESLKIIKKKGIHLDELALAFASEHNGYMNLILDELETMYKKDVFKQLFLNFEKKSMITEHIQRLVSMPFLKGMICAYRIDNTIDNHLADLAKLKNIKYLCINYLLLNSDLIAEQLDQLVEVKIDEVTIDVIVSFVRHSAKLAHFHNKHIRGNVKLNVVALNSERAKLKYKGKLNIYIPEEKFMKLKWSAAPVAADWVEIRREESYIPRRVCL